MINDQRVGIESLLAMAAVDESFAAALYERRAEAIASSGVQLSPAEQQILASVDRSTLQQMVTNVGAAIPEPDRRAFLSRSAAALLALAGGASVAGAPGCKEPVVTRGVQPDRPLTKGIQPDRPQPQGIRPDRPSKPDSGPSAEQDAAPSTPASQQQWSTDGIRPDRPPPKKIYKTRGIQPDRPVKTGISPDRPEPKKRGNDE